MFASTCASCYLQTALMQTTTCFLRLLTCLGLALLSPVAEASTAKALKTIRAVGPEGGGNAEATTAWQELSKADAKSLVDILEAMNGANELAVNWLRAAVDSIAAREL